MRLEFRPEADADLTAIIGYFKQTAPDALGNVLADLERSFAMICEYPTLYPLQAGRSYRRHVTRRYRFKIVYDVLGDRIDVLGVFRFQNWDV
jgi:plasmid stabilization system protein ParE